MTSRPLAAASLGTALATLAAFPVSAQERCRLSWEIPPAESTYTQQHAIDVGDVPWSSSPRLRGASPLPERQAELRRPEAHRFVGPRLL
jgi:hypothetical protein